MLTTFNIVCSVDLLKTLMFCICSQDFEVQLLLDAKKPKSPRMFLLSEAGRNVMNYTLQLDKDFLLCKSFPVYIKVSNVCSKCIS
jgi:hypothetical protein